MKNSQRILDSIGKLSDSMIESAMSYENPENKRKKMDISPARPMKKLAVSIIAAVLCVALAVTCFANADLIKSLFQREQELVDPYAIKVDNSVTVGDITLTIDKVTWGNDYYVYYTLKNNKGVFENGLTFDRIVIRETPWDVMIPTDGIIGSSSTKEIGSDPTSSIAIAGYGLENPSDTISTMFRASMLFGKYTLAFENVTSYDGSIKYADEIVFDLELVAADEAEPQPDSTPEQGGKVNVNGARRKLEITDNTFILEGKEFIINAIWLSPYEMSFNIKEYRDETVNYFGYDFYYSSYIGGFDAGRSKEIVDEMAKTYSFIEYDDAKTDSEILSRAFEITDDLEPHKAELDALSYKAYITLADSCTSEVIDINHHGYCPAERKLDDGSVDSYNSCDIFIYFSTPVYEEEILEVYLLRESDGARVTIYEKPE